MISVSTILYSKVKKKKKEEKILFLGINAHGGDP